MKRIVLLLSVMVLLMLAACTGSAAPNADSDTVVPEEIPAPPPEEPKEELPEYVFEKTALRAEEQALRDSGEVVGYYTYELPQMYIANENNLTEEGRTTALQNAETFNTRMREVLDEAVHNGEEMLRYQEILVEEESVDFVVCDELSSNVYRVGQIVSVVSQCYYYGGGAHPFSYTVTYVYDLSVGQFIDPAQIGDDPEKFRTAAAQLLIEHAESLGEDYVDGYWADYQEIISRWNETAVFFDDTGMTVIFSAYELGPYAMGPVELTLTYEELADVIGEGGLTHLGVLHTAE